MSGKMEGRWSVRAGPFATVREAKEWVAARLRADTGWTFEAES